MEEITVDKSVAENWKTKSLKDVKVDDAHPHPQDAQTRDLTDAQTAPHFATTLGYILCDKILFSLWCLARTRGKDDFLLGREV